MIRLHYRPGHFLVQGHPLATVWPPEAADAVTRSLERAHLTGPYRTLAQDLSFAVDQLVEIAIRALSAAVNDTFTALTCIDWLGESLCKIAAEWSPTQVHRDESGQVRLISAAVGYQRIVERAYEKIRQASRGMPAVMIRQLDALEKVMEYTTTAAQRDVLIEQARRIQTGNLESVPEAADRADVTRAYDAVLAARVARGARRSWSDPAAQRVQGRATSIQPLAGGQQHARRAPSRARWCRARRTSGPRRRSRT